MSYCSFPLAVQLFGTVCDYIAENAPHSYQCSQPSVCDVDNPEHSPGKGNLRRRSYTWTHFYNDTSKFVLFSSWYLAIPTQWTFWPWALLKHSHSGHSAWLELQILWYWANRSSHWAIPLSQHGTTTDITIRMCLSSCGQFDKQIKSIIILESI